MRIPEYKIIEYRLRVINVANPQDLSTQRRMHSYSEYAQRYYACKKLKLLFLGKTFNGINSMNCQILLWRCVVGSRDGLEACNTFVLWTIIPFSQILFYIFPRYTPGT